MITAEHKLNVFIQRVKNNKKILPSNKKNIINFLKSREAKGNAPNTLIKYLYPLYQMNSLGWVKKPFDKLTKKDVETIVRKVEKYDWSPKTKKNFRLSLKVFYRWLEGEEKFAPNEYPQRVKFISTGIPKRQRKELSFNEIIEREEVIKMAQQTINPMHKALLWVAFESGGRPEEVLNLRKSDIEFDAYGTKIFMRGAKSKRPARLVSATEPLRDWLRKHPLAHQNDFDVWITQFNKKDNNGTWSRLGDPGANRMLKALAKKAKIVNKKITMYSLRRGRATELAGNSHISRAVLHAVMGWEEGSSVSRHYVKLNNRDVEDAMLRASGIEVSKQEIESFIECHACGSKNSPSALYCERVECGKPLILSDAMRELRKQKKDYQVMMNEVKVINRSKEELEQLIKDVKEFIKEKNTEKQLVDITRKTTGY